MVAVGLDPITANAEYRPGQTEINFGPAWGVAAADHAFTFKNRVKETARQHGMIASFMTKPQIDQSANGCHFHQALGTETKMPPWMILAKMSYNLNLSDDVLIHPERALEASIAYRIMSFGMRNGSFTGVRLSDYISGSKCEYYDARQIVNGHDQAALIQGYAQKLETLLRESSNGKEGSKGTSTYQYYNSADGLRKR